jgi:hypothetical protein
MGFIHDAGLGNSVRQGIQALTFFTVRVPIRQY